MRQRTDQKYPTIEWPMSIDGRQIMTIGLSRWLSFVMNDMSLAHLSYGDMCSLCPSSNQKNLPTIEIPFSFLIFFSLCSVHDTIKSDSRRRTSVQFSSFSLPLATCGSCISRLHGPLDFDIIVCDKDSVQYSPIEISS